MGLYALRAFVCIQFNAADDVHTESRNRGMISDDYIVGVSLCDPITSEFNGKFLQSDYAHSTHAAVCSTCTVSAVIACLHITSVHLVSDPDYCQLS